MPQFGLKTAEQIGSAAPVELSAFPPLPWALTGAEVAQLTFEVDLESALELMPQPLARPAPPYARIIVARYQQSPVGPYSEALLLLSVRYRMEPKNYVVAAVVSSEAARAAYAGIWGLPCTIGTVALRRQRDAATGTEDITATIATGAPLATLMLPRSYAVEPAMIRYDPLLSVRLAPGGEAEVIQFSGAATVREGRLAKGAAATCQTDAWADPWFRLRSLNTISATFAAADLELTAPVVQRQGAPAAAAGGP